MHTAPHEVTIGAAINGPQVVTLYNLEGQAIQIDATNVDYWLGLGFRRTIADPIASAKALKAMFKAAGVAVDAYVDGVTSDGVIDPADDAAYATFAQAMREIEVTANQLHLDLARLYPVKQGPSVAMLDENGTEVRVDPGQVDLYLAKGHQEVKA